MWINSININVNLLTIYVIWQDWIVYKTNWVIPIVKTCALTLLTKKSGQEVRGSNLKAKITENVSIGNFSVEPTNG